MTTSKELKRRARAVLEGKYSLATSLTTTLLLFTVFMNFLLQKSGFSSSPEPMHQAFFWILWAIMTLLTALLEIGLVKFLYSLSLKKLILNPSVLLYAFKNQPDTFILTSGFRYLIALIWFVPSIWKYLHLPMETLELTELPAALLPVLGLALLGIIPAVLVSLPFCMTDYVLLDDPYCSALEALKTSCTLTKGQYKRILLLWISFLPMFLLAFGSYGVGLLWVKPYYHTTMNQFYIELTGKEIEEAAENVPSQTTAEI